jgi:MFS family permease
LIFLVDYKLFMLLRLVQGICAGVFSALVPLIIKELAPLELAGVFGVFNQLFITLGIFSCCFLTFLLGLWQQDESGRRFWEIVFAGSLVTVGLQTLMLHTVFKMETPQYLVNCKQDE